LCDTTELTNSSGRLDGPIVEICVGKEPHQKIFSVHQAIIAPRSEFFERVFDKNWKESESRLVNLPDDDATIFGLYVQLLYTGQIPPKDVDWDYIKPSKLYVLCEKLQDIDAKNTILRELLAQIRVTQTWTPSALAVNAIYDGTPENSPVRNLFLDIFVERGNCVVLYRDLSEGEYPLKFVTHLAVELFKQRRFIRSETLASCKVGKYQEEVKEKEYDQKVKEKERDKKVEKIEVSWRNQCLKAA
jgi:hypothetical protein